jgi:DHA2 family multidrug resistance protein
VVGPLLGGWITDNISWPWIFYINVPVGVVAAFATWAIYRTRETATAKVPVDKVGIALLVVWVGALQVLLDKGKDLDWFHSAQIVTLAMVAAVSFAAFLVWELTDAHPIVDLSLFARRNFWAGTLALSLAYGTFFGNVVLLPLWLQQYMGYTATLAGFALAPVGVLAILLTPLVGRNLGRIDPRVIVTVSFLIFALALTMRSHFSTDATLGTILVPTVVQGAAMACFFVPLMSLALSGLPPERMPSASGLLNFSRITAGSFGTSIATTLWDRRATWHRAELVEHIGTAGHSPAATLSALGSHGLGNGQAYAALGRTVEQQAFTLSANDIFLASAWLFVALIAVVWLARPGRERGGAASAAAGAH